MLCGQVNEGCIRIAIDPTTQEGEIIMCTQAIAIEEADERGHMAVGVRWSIAGLLCWAREAVLLLILSHALRKAKAELQDLDDRMLEDIGITRSEIDRVLMIQMPVRWDGVWPLFRRTQV